jgi:hypothetical protein
MNPTQCESFFLYSPSQQIILKRNQLIGTRRFPIFILFIEILLFIAKSPIENEPEKW